MSPSSYSYTSNICLLLLMGMKSKIYKSIKKRTVSATGELGSFIQVNVTLGILYVYAIGPFVNYEGLAIMCGSLPVIWFVLVLIFVPESPMYLWRYGRKREAEDSLVLLRGRDYDVAAELDALQLQLEQEQKSNRTFKDLISSRATIRAAVIMLGLLMFLSCSGINVLIFYAESIFKYSNSSVSPKICPVIIGVLQVSTYLYYLNY